MVRESISRQKMLLNVPKHLRKQHSHVSSNSAPKMSLHAPYCTTKYPSTTLGTMETRHRKDESKGRLLLREVRGPTQACQLKGLLEDKEHWNKAFKEEAASLSPKILSNLFAVMLRTYSMSSPEQLWMDHKENLSEDILLQARIQQKNMDLDYCDAIFNRALIDIEDKIILMGGSDLKSFGLPQPNRNRDSVLPSEERTERNYALIK
ncbi:hypothetical protein AVEN_43909-1 [Araneus ventricosus]|uniref:Uncharacterized protein n=2 Tax=Araneus ventricosus TaxID=182803 RepID=A0A4Y2PVL6_ARAVE|nr:hypothetical protein AVEN_43909-1 [Araneus ventricosus]